MAISSKNGLARLSNAVYGIDRPLPAGAIPAVLLAAYLGVGGAVLAGGVLGAVYLSAVLATGPVAIVLLVALPVGSLAASPIVARRAVVGLRRRIDEARAVDADVPVPVVGPAGESRP